MAGALVVGCGARGRIVVSRLAESGCSTLSIDWSDADVSILPPGMIMENCRKDNDFVREQLMVHRNEILLNMRGATQILLIIGLGGSLSSASFDIVVGCARELGLRVVTLMTLPFEFEGRRRDAVVYALPALAEMADRTFVIDLQHSFEIVTKINDRLDDILDLLKKAAELIMDYMENHPFMSTFPSRMYALSSGERPSLIESYEAAADSIMFDRAFITDWTPVVCVDAGTDRESMALLFRNVADRCGSVPQVLPCKGMGRGATVFIPVDLLALSSTSRPDGSASPHPRRLPLS